VLGWHGDGTAGEHDRASHLIVEALARPMVRPIQGDPSLRASLAAPEGARQAGHKALNRLVPVAMAEFALLGSTRRPPVRKLPTAESWAQGEVAW
jgi:hypothetical protein